MKSHLSRWLPPLIWALLIFLTSANPDPYRPLPANWESLPSLPANTAFVSQGISRAELLGRYLHVGEYLVLAFLLARALVWERRLHFLILTWALGLSTLYAILDEIHQTLIPGRAFQFLDLGLDVIGVSIGLALYSFWWHRLERQSQLQSV